VNNKTGPMTPEEIKEHKKNPNVTIRLTGQQHYFRCGCGCNVFHHEDNWDVYICNSCKTEYVSDK
jgi:hypothetical protein